MLILLAKHKKKGRHKDTRPYWHFDFELVASRPVRQYFFFFFIKPSSSLEESEKAGLKLNIHKQKIMSSGSITS